jgi:exosortase
MQDKKSLITLTRADILNKAPLVLKCSVLLLSTIVFYLKDLFAIFSESLQNEFMSYMLTIPFFLTYLAYRKRKILSAVIAYETKTSKDVRISGVLLLALSILVYWHGSYTFQPIQLHMISLPIFIAGCILIIFNLRTLRESVFPMIFLAFLVPLTLESLSLVGAALSVLSSSISYTVLKFFGLPINMINQYGIPIIVLERAPNASIFFAIDIPCAGMYSLMGFLIFAFFLAYIVRGIMWKKAFLFIIGLPLIYGLNIIRIITIVLIGYEFGQDLATQVFHFLGGWALISLGTLIILFLSEKLMKIQIFTKKSTREPCPNCDKDPRTDQNFCQTCGRILTPMNMKIDKRDILKVSVLLVCISLLANLQLSLFALTKADIRIDLQTPSGEKGYEQLLPGSSDYQLRFVYRDRAFEERTNQDASLIYLYLPNDSQQTPVWTTLEISRYAAALHEWELCLGDQPSNVKLDLKEIGISENPPLVGRFYAFQGSKSIQVVLYWYQRFLFTVEQGFEEKWVKTSLIVFTDSSEKISGIEEELLPLTKKIIDYWEPVKTGAQTILIISRYGATLIWTLAALLSIMIMSNAVGDIRRRRSNLRAFNRLVLKEEKLVIRAVHEANKRGISTTLDIASIYSRLAQKTIPAEDLLQKLNQAEKIGLITKNITNKEDAPILGWKNKIPF